MEKARIYASGVLVFGSEGLPMHHSQGPTLELHSPSPLCVLAMRCSGGVMQCPNQQTFAPASEHRRTCFSMRRRDSEQKWTERKNFCRGLQERSSLTALHGLP